MSRCKAEEFREQLEKAVNKNDTVAVERIIQEYVELGNEYGIRHVFWVKLCENALKNKCLPIAKLVLPPECISNIETSKTLMKAAIESDFTEGVKFLHSKGIPLSFALPSSNYLLHSISGNYWSVLIECAKNNKVEVLKYLLKLKYLDKNPDREHTLIMLCCHELNIESLKILLNSELINTINQQSWNLGYSALQFCIDGMKKRSSLFGIDVRNPKRVLDCVKLLVEAGANVNLQAGNGKSPIQLAANRGMVTTVIYLVQTGASLDMTTNQGTLLHCLAGSDQKADSYDECVQLLITHGMDINQLNSSNKTPLYLAVCQGNEEMVGSLIKSGCDVNIKLGYDMESVLIQLAANRGMVTTVIYLVQTGASLDMTTNQGTLLHCLAGSDQKADSYDECVQLLITHGMDINQLNSSNKTPLYLAVCQGNEEMVGSLIKSGCDVNIKLGYDMESVLMASIRRQRTAIAEILIKAGCDVNSTDKNGVTPLMESVKTDNHVLVKQLIGHGAFVHAKDNNGCFVLDYSFRYNYLFPAYHYTNDQSASADIVKMLIEAGADIHKCDNLLRRALVQAYYATASLLIEHGIDVNTVDENGDKPLALASQTGKLELVTLLISKDCDINHQNLKGKTSLHKAILVSRLHKAKKCRGYSLQNRGEVIKLLLQNGMNVNLGDFDGQTALFMAVGNGERSITKDLLKAGANVNHCDKKRQTPLMTAASNCNRSILECLLEAGADVDKTDTDGRSAIYGIMVGSRGRDRKWINCLKLLLTNKCHVSLGTPEKNRKTLFEWLLENDEADLIWYLVTENCSLQSLDLRRVKDKFQFPDTLMLSKILFESGAEKNDIISSLDTGVSSSRCVSFREVFEGKHLDKFRDFCKSRSLKSRCRRVIRECIGPGISSKITQVGLPKYLQDYVVMKDLIPEKYFTLVLNDKDDDDCSDIYYSTDDSSDHYYSTEEDDDYNEEDYGDYYDWSD
ncbi:serine/threonine-protein phosphatase 6 regulatory ankyrin repeat subunit B [Patella vulgata]|uniref:serine/threonine-protein phosphatase 6 regulatory ankyrin repeat subunit B n=1 Tax=Patella vulgata TaxID=6465 RepID=UPI0024A9D2D2|nr:serine/threonine-protein phosphatase 6 regulatory ankyrin repeat subunit B [Patella vulgata]